MWYYLVLKKCKSPRVGNNVKYYNEVISFILGYYSVTSWYNTYEYDSKNIFHCNCVFEYKRELNFAILHYKGCHIDVQKVKGIAKMFIIMKYIHKDYQLKIYTHQLI